VSDRRLPVHKHSFEVSKLKAANSVSRSKAIQIVAVRWSGV